MISLIIDTANIFWSLLWEYQWCSFACCCFAAYFLIYLKSFFLELWLKYIGLLSMWKNIYIFVLFPSPPGLSSWLLEHLPSWSEKDVLPSWNLLYLFSVSLVLLSFVSHLKCNPSDVIFTCIFAWFFFYRLLVLQDPLIITQPVCCLSYLSPHFREFIFFPEFNRKHMGNNTVYFKCVIIVIVSCLRNAESFPRCHFWSHYSS